MSSMGMDFFTNSRSRSIPPTPRYARCTRSILLKVMTLRFQYLMATMAQARRMKSIEKRTGNNVGASVSVSSEMRLTMSKKAFLSNESNKQALITLLSQEMSKAGISVAHAEGDADYKICKMACASAVRQPTAEVSCYQKQIVV